MKYYERLLHMKCFSRGDLVRLTGSADAAGSLIYSYKRKGFIDSVRRDLFVAISLETKQPVASRFVIATYVAPDATVSHHSAFEYYGYANQVYHEVYVASNSRFRSFEYGGVIYRPVSPVIKSGVDREGDGARVTDIERTVLDSINDFEKIGGLEELLRCLSMVPYLDAEKLSRYLAVYDKKYLYQKTGYILEQFSDALYLPDTFFEFCRDNVPSGKRYLYHGLQREPHVFTPDWRLYVPPNLLTITSKGDEPDEAI
jgi:predicted transcriptional regulator of viral defense system